MIVGRWIALKKGRWTKGIATALLLFGPFVIVYLIIAKTDSDALTEEMIKKGERKRCPFRVNIIHAQAIKCSFCSSDVEEKPELAEQETSREGKEGEEES